MRRSTDTIGRQWDILQLIPREPRSITASQIRERLSERGHDVDLRTVQRDLGLLEAKFVLRCRTEGRTNHWYWERDQAPLQIPRLDGPAAITLLLVRDYLLPLLPKPAGDELAPYFSKARETLKGTKLEHWRRRVRMIRRGPVLQAPNVDRDVQDVVYQALLEGRRIEVDYRNRGAKTAQRLLIHPLGLVAKEDVLYLVATLFEYSDPRQLALHRMSQAELKKEAINVPAGFELKAYVDEGRFGYPVSEGKIRLVALFSEDAAAHLYERRLSANQRLERTENAVVLRAAVSDTSELRWWLLGFGSQVEILEPAELRHEFMAISRAMAALYEEPPSRSAPKRGVDDPAASRSWRT